MNSDFFSFHKHKSNVSAEQGFMDTDQIVVVRTIRLANEKCPCLKK